MGENDGRAEQRNKERSREPSGKGAQLALQGPFLLQGHRVVPGKCASRWFSAGNRVTQPLGLAELKGAPPGPGPEQAGGAKSQAFRAGCSVRRGSGGPRGLALVSYPMWGLCVPPVGPDYFGWSQTGRTASSRGAEPGHLGFGEAGLTTLDNRGNAAVPRQRKEEKPGGETWARG